MPDVLSDKIAPAPKTYHILKQKGFAGDHAQIDNSPARGQPRRIAEGDPGFAAALDGRNGSDGTGEAGPDLRQEARSERPGGLNRIQQDLKSARADFGDLTLRLKDRREVSADDLLAGVAAEARQANALNPFNPGAQA